MLKTRNRNWNIRDDQTIFETMRLFENTSAGFNLFNEEQSENMDFTVSALQWDKTVRAKLRKEGRPANSYNLIRTILNIIFSIERDNRKQGKAKPEGIGDEKTASIITQVVRFYLYRSGFSQAQKRVFMDKLSARLGIFHLGWRYEGSEDQNGSLFVEAVDPREIRWECGYNDPLWENASYIMRKHEMSLEEILNTYALRDNELRIEIQKEAKVFFDVDPQRGKWVSRKIKALFSAVYETATGTASQQSQMFNNALQWWNPQTGKFDVLELHEKRMERRLIVNEGENRLIDITDTYHNEYKALNNKDNDGYDFEAEIINGIKERYSLKGEADVDLQNRRFVTAVIPTFYLKVNEQVYPFDSKYYNYIPEYCYDTHPDPMRLQSVIDDVKDPQMDFNKAKSLILELLARYANKGWILDENAIDGLEDDWTTNRITPFRRVRAGYIGMIKPEEGQTISPELIRMPMETQQLIKIITNADDEIRGNASPGVKSGKHFLAKEQRQAKSFTTLLENRDQTHKAVYEQALGFIQHYVKSQQVIRITRDIQPGLEEDQQITVNQSVYAIKDGEPQETVINDLDAQKYDIEIADEPYSASAQDERLEKIGSIFEATKELNPKRADAMLPIIVKTMGTPEADEILKVWKELEAPNPQQQQMEEMMLAIQKIMVKLEIEEKQLTNEGIELDNLKKAQEIKQLQIQNVFSKFAPEDNKNNGKKDQKIVA